MEYTRSGDLIALRVNRGEEIISCVKAACEKEQVHFGSISGIGAVDHAVVGLYHVADKRYESNTFDGEMEMTSLLGNATEKDGQVYLHFHCLLYTSDAADEEDSVDL